MEEIGTLSIYMVYVLPNLPRQRINPSGHRRVKLLSALCTLKEARSIAKTFNLANEDFIRKVRLEGDWQVSPVLLDTEDFQS